MIKTRLVKLLVHARKYIIWQVVWQWLSLLSQILLIFQAAGLLRALLEGTLTGGEVAWRAGVSALCIAARFFFERQASYASYAASVDVKRILRERIYSKLLRLGASYREKTATAEVVQMSVEGVEQLETYFGKYLPQLFYSLLAPVTLFLILLPVNWQASLVLLICVPLIPVSIVAVQKIAKRLLSKYWGVYTELGDSFLENLQGLTTLKIYQGDRQAADKMDEESQRFRRITMKVLTMQLNSTSVMDIVAYGGAAVGMAVALTQFFAGRVDLAGVLTIVLLAAEFFLPLRLLGSFFHIAMNGMAASDRIFAFLDLPEPKEKIQRLSGGPVEVRMEGVSFSYEEERPILKQVDMVFPKGSFVALAGASGCGKSTAVGLLMGRNQGYTGSITVEDGGRKLELSQLNEASLMEQFTLISHNSYLFKGTVRENLLLGDPEATPAQMRAALEQVNLWGFLASQQGLDTPVAEKGGNFSGGQCQRLALARALLHDTPVYLFDEATSNIDVESEEQIMEVIHRLAKTKTVILISHRLANVVQAKTIYLLRDGMVAQSGSHQELKAQGGPYKDLFDQQRELEAYGKEAQA